MEEFETTGQQLIEEGRQEGRQEVALRMLRRILSHRFGPLSDHLAKRLNLFSAEQLEVMVERAFEASRLEEVLEVESRPRTGGRPSTRDMLDELAGYVQTGNKVAAAILGATESLIEEGRQKGRQEATRRMLGRILSHRFDPLSDDLVNRLDSLSIDAIEVMTDFALEASPRKVFKDAP